MINLNRKFHKDYEHNTNEHVTLKDEIETWIRKGKLVKYKPYNDQGVRRERDVFKIPVGNYAQKSHLSRYKS